MTQFVIYPGLDDEYNFPPEVRQQIANSPEMATEFMPRSESSTTYAPILSAGKGIPRAYSPFDAPFNAIGGTNDDTAAFQALLDAIPDNCTVNIPAPITVSNVTLNKRYVTMTGPGLVKGRLKIGTTGTRRDLFTNLVGMNFDGGSTYSSGSMNSGTACVELLKARAVTIERCTFSNVDKAIYINPLSDAVAHDTGMITIHKNRFYGVNYALYADRDNAVTWMHFSDSKFTENTVNVAYITHVWVKSVDGLHITGNVFFFISYNSTDTAALNGKKNNIYVGQSNFLHIGRNNLFEAGEEAILLDAPSRFEVTNNNIAWPGQKVASDGIKLTGNNTLNGLISDNMISKMTKDGISIYSTGTGTVAVKDNVIEYDASTGTYYGTPALSSFTHYGLYQDPSSPINMFDGGSNDMTGGLYVNRKGSLISTLRLNNDVGVSGSKTSVMFTALTAAPVFTLFSTRFGQLTFSGEILVEAKSADTENGNLSVYKLLVSKGPLGYYITKLAEQGLLTGGSANWPSFTWTIDDTTGKLVATPVGSTAGTFYFYSTATGNLRALVG